MIGKANTRYGPEARRRLGMVALAVATVGVLAAPATAGDDTVKVRIPVCAEDEPFLRGRGDFDGQRWTRYVCVHIDDVR